MDDYGFDCSYESKCIITDSYYDNDYAFSEDDDKED